MSEPPKIAVNKKTGEKLILMDGKWQPYHQMEGVWEDSGPQPAGMSAADKELSDATVSKVAPEQHRPFSEAEIESRPQTSARGIGAQLNERSSRVATGTQVGGAEAATRGASDALSSGLDAKTSGLGAALVDAPEQSAATADRIYNMLHGLPDLGRGDAVRQPLDAGGHTAYERARDQWRGDLGRAEEDQPAAALAGELAGGVAQGAALGGPLAKATGLERVIAPANKIPLAHVEPSFLRSLLGGIGLGGLFGAASGAGHTDVDSTEPTADAASRLAKNTATGATTGGATGGLMSMLMHPLGSAMYDRLGADAGRLEDAGGKFSVTRGAELGPEGDAIALRAKALRQSGSEVAAADAEPAVRKALGDMVGKSLQEGGTAEDVAANKLAVLLQKAADAKTRARMEEDQAYKASLDDGEPEIPLDSVKGRYGEMIKENVQEGGRLPDPGDTADAIDTEPKPAALHLSPVGMLRQGQKQLPDLVNPAKLQRQIQLYEDKVQWAKQHGSPEEGALKSALEVLLQVRDEYAPVLSAHNTEMSRQITQQEDVGRQLGASRPTYENPDRNYGNDINAFINSGSKVTEANRAAIEDLISGSPLESEIRAAIARLRDVQGVEPHAMDFDSIKGQQSREALGKEVVKAGNMQRGQAAHERLTKAPRNLSGSNVTNQAVRMLSPGIEARVAGLKNTNAPPRVAVAANAATLAKRKLTARERRETQEGKGSL